MRFEVKARVKRRGGFLLDVILDTDAGVLGLSGPSGSGKSTLLDVVAGFELGHTVFLDGESVGELPPELRKIGYVPQESHLFPHLDVRENLLFSPRALELEGIPEALGIAHLLGRYPRHLSGGERRRVALGRALVSRPRLLLLDEPFTGLDEARRQDVMGMLGEIRHTHGLPMVLVSHRAEELRALADVMVRLEGGKVLS